MLNQQGIDVITQDNLQALYQDIMTKGELV
jgi:hypothetical protein